MIPPKESNKSLITDPKEMDIYEHSDKEFIMALLKEFSEPQEHTERQLNKIRKTMHEKK